ncbi:DUF6702 family protein [Mangrovibacterium lignilyticum]|uniref:DUF6702 family protein n=1 Tax=Mangrovibacterium lignilyticum TaxID=2668052 RepID=UPI0013D8B535|nr:DUF6702 family protein [Mangrovibacterium lignilyticum]
MKRFFILILSVLLIAALPQKAKAHPFHVSMCEVKYNADEQRLEIALKIFIDDLNMALSKSGIEDQHFGEADEKEDADLILKTYLQKVLLLTINSEEKELNYLGKDFDGSSLWAYIEVDNVASIQTFEATNTLFFELYKDQQNIIQLTYQDKTRSLLLHRGNTSDKLEY